MEAFWYRYSTHL